MSQQIPICPERKQLDKRNAAEKTASRLKPAGHSNSIYRQGPKPLFFWALNVAAEAATHKDYLRDSLRNKTLLEGKSLNYAAILFLGVCRS
jgi:hypothetical protein